MDGQYLRRVLGDTLVEGLKDAAPPASYDLRAASEMYSLDQVGQHFDERLRPKIVDISTFNESSTVLTRSGLTDFTMKGLLVMGQTSGKYSGENG
jgi:hypothetical protein